MWMHALCLRITVIDTSRNHPSRIGHVGYIRIRVHTRLSRRCPL